MNASRTLAVLAGLVALAVSVVLIAPRLLTTDPSRSDAARPAAIQKASAKGAIARPAASGKAERTRTAERDAMTEVPQAADSALDSSATGGCVTGRVLGPEGAPLAQSAASLFRVSREDGGHPIASTKADENGSFRLDGIAPATGLVVELGHDGFLALTVGDVAVRAGETTDLGDRRLKLGSRASGLVVDTEGNPVPQATVSAHRFFDGLESPSCTTGPDGAFRVTGLSSGPCLLSAKAPGFAPASLDMMMLKGEDDEVKSLRIVLSRGLTLAGRVTSAAGDPIAGARVRLQSEAMMPAGDGDVSSDDASPRARKTDASGGFELRDVAPGPCRLEVEADGYARAEVTASGGATDFLVTLVKKGSVRGRVFDSRTGDPVSDFTVWTEVSGEAPFRFSFGGDGANAPPGDARRVEGSKDGSFTLDGVEPGTYEVHVRSKGYAEGKSDSLTVGPAPDVAETQVVLVSGGSIRGVVRAEGTGRAVSGAKITAVPDKDSSSSDHRTMAVFVAGQVDGDRDDWLESIEASAESGADGEFLLTEMPAGSYKLSARHPDMARAEVTRVAVATGEETGPITITLGSAGGVEGYVTDVDRAPLPGARVTARTGRGFARTVKTDDDGRYELRNLSPDTYFVKRETDEPGGGMITMVATSSGGPSSIQLPGVSVEVAANKVVRLDFSDADLGAIAGRVLDGEKPVEGATVDLGTEGFMAMPQTRRTDPDGVFAFERLDPGKYDLGVRLEPDPRGLVSESLEIGAGRRVERDLVLPTGTIEGTVLDLLAHQPLEGAVASAESISGDGAGGGGTRMMIRRGLGGDSASGITTNREGRFRIPYLAPGRYRVTAAKEGYGQDSKEPVEIKASGDTASGVEIQLSPGGVLAGRVVDAATGAPLAQAGVQGHDAAGHPLLLSGFTFTDSDGRFLLSGIRPGPCTLSVFKFGYDHWSGEASIAPRGESAITVPLKKEE